MCLYVCIHNKMVDGEGKKSKRDEELNFIYLVHMRLVL